MRAACSLLTVLLLLSVSIARNAVWQDERGIWNDTIAKSPRKFRAYNELALGLIAAGDYEPAYVLLVRSLQINPYQQQVYINLGLAFEHLGRLPDAVRMYEQAIRLQPGDPTAFYNLGVLYYNDFRERDRALAFFLQARDRDPFEPDVHQYLALIYEERGDTALALQERALHEQLRHR